MGSACFSSLHHNLPRQIEGVNFLMPELSTQTQRFVPAVTRANYCRFSFMRSLRSAPYINQASKTDTLQLLPWYFHDVSRVQWLSTGWTAGVRSPAEAEIITSSSRLNPLRSPISLLIYGYLDFPFGRENWSGPLSDHSPKFCAEVKKISHLQLLSPWSS
jgi:hypothetical protein